MKKTFTVHSLQHKEVSPGKGAISWLLSDEKGRPRKITGVTHLDKEGAIETITPVYKRETPLVNRLYLAEKGDVFDIDFTEFNRREGYKAREVYDNMRTVEKASGLAAGVKKYLLILGAVALLWFTYTVLHDVSLMELNFIQ